MASIDTPRPSWTDQRLEQRLGYTFRDPALLRHALTHSSAVVQAEESYERLEFLGDRVLGLVVADILLARFPEDPEGHLSKRLNSLVRRETLADIARDLALGPALVLGPSEDVGGRDNASILADVVEAVIAALYIDGGLDAAQRFIQAHWSDLVDADLTPPRDGKSALQEWTMARGLDLPRYEQVGRSGPDHAPLFTIRVSVTGHESVAAEGKSKRMAEQAAAESLLARLEAKD